MYDNSMVVPIVIGVLLGFLVFLAMREIYCWYFKINKAIGLLYQIRDLLARQGGAAFQRDVYSQVQGYGNPPEPRPPASQAGTQPTPPPSSYE